MRHQRKGYGDALRAPATDVKGMEMHVGPRPVMGGPGRTGVNIWVQTKSHGGSRGPADPWSASTASKRWDLWFFRSRKNNDNTICCKIDSRRAKPKNQATRPRPLKPIKKKSTPAKRYLWFFRKNNDMSRRCKKEGHNPKLVEKKRGGYGGPRAPRKDSPREDPGGSHSL